MMWERLQSNQIEIIETEANKEEKEKEYSKIIQIIKSNHVHGELKIPHMLYDYVKEIKSNMWIEKYITPTEQYNPKFNIIDFKFVYFAFVQMEPHDYGINWFDCFCILITIRNFMQKNNKWNRDLIIAQPLEISQDLINIVKDDLCMIESKLVEILNIIKHDLQAYNIISK